MNMPIGTTTEEWKEEWLKATMTHGSWCFECNSTMVVFVKKKYCKCANYCVDDGTLLTKIKHSNHHQCNTCTRTYADDDLEAGIKFKKTPKPLHWWYGHPKATEYKSNIDNTFIESTVFFIFSLSLIIISILLFYAAITEYSINNISKHKAIIIFILGIIAFMPAIASIFDNIKDITIYNEEQPVDNIGLRIFVVRYGKVLLGLLIFYLFYMLIGLLLDWLVEVI